jgi:hypothetical protein
MVCASQAPPNCMVCKWPEVAFDIERLNSVKLFDCTLLTAACAVVDWGT